MAGCTDSNRLSGVKTTSDGATYTYDANGNIASGAGRTYIWNSDNRLDQVTGPGGSAVMTYDYTGIRIKKSGSSGTSYFPFTGYEIQGGTVTKYVRIGNEIIASKQGTTKRFYHNDHLGGVNIISDINGNQVQLTEYDPWGKTSRSVNLVDLTHRFTGQELDSESDVYYYGGRYYSQALGRFISPDPFVQDPDDPQNLNRYSYVLNGPQNYVDPSGYFFDDEGSGDFSSIGMTREATGSSFQSYISSIGSTFGTACCGSIGGSGSTNWETLGSSALAGLQTAGSIGSAYWGATAIGGAIAAGGCAVALPVCLGGGVALLGGIYGASDALTSLWKGEYKNTTVEVAKSFGASPILAMGIAGGIEVLGARGLGGNLADKVSAYSIAFETTIAKTGAGTRSAHFASANKNLETAIASDPRFANMMEGLGIRIPDNIRTSPANWTWHHVPDQPGVLQLVPRAQHKPGSLWQWLLHPNRIGGFNQWGSEY